MKSRTLVVSFVALVIFCFAGSAAAQTATGTPPFSTVAGSSFDSVDLANLNAHFAISVLSKAGRGIPFSYTLSYDSLIWTKVTSGATTSWQPVTGIWGWKGISENNTGYIGKKITRGGVCYDFNSSKWYNVTTTYSNWYYRDKNGTVHKFNGQTDTTFEICDPPEPDDPNLTAVATDGSGYKLIVTNYVDAYVLSPSGSVIDPDGSNSSTFTNTDTNGNQISNNGTNFYDTLSSTTPVVTASGSGTASSPQVLSYAAPSGATAHVTINYTNYTIKTNFGCTGVTDYGPIANTPLVSSIVFDDGSSYQFTYEPTPGYSGDYTGRIHSVTLPTGGQVIYTYSGSNNGVVCSDGSTAGLTRQTPDGTWSYTRTPGTGAAYTTVVTDPQSNQTSIQFQGLYQTKKQVYQGSTTSGTLLQTVDTCFNGNTNIGTCTTTAVTLPITRKTSWTSYPSSAGKQNKTDSYFNSYGQPTETDEYDFGGLGAGSGGLVRKTTITYASLGNGIVNHPSNVSVYDGSGSLKAQTTYGYDESSVTTTSGTPQHVSISGSRGNLTSVHRSTGSTTLNQTFTYYDTGNVNVATDVNGAQTSYSYGACGNSFPTTVTLPTVNTSLTRQAAWNCTGGVITSTTDENGNIGYTNYTTDPYFWRPESSTDTANNTTTYSYSYISHPGFFQVEGRLDFNSGASTFDVLTTTDSSGRPRLVQKRQGPGSGNFDSTQTDYNSLGQVWRQYRPFQSTAGSPAGSFLGTTTAYDALGRPISTTDSGGGTVSVSYTYNDVYRNIGPAPTGENAKRKQLEYDGLGRLSSVCEVTSASGSGSCAQSVAQTGYWTRYTYDTLGNLTGVTQNAQGTSQTRSFVFDRLSRMTSETNPENGTTSYTFDSDATCGASSGDLVKRVDAVGNVTCYRYDALHRLTDVTYPSGPYASRTPTKHYVYDSATVNSVVMANAKGRLARAYTSASIGFQNTDFESSSSLPPVGWSASAATLSYDTTTQHAGARSLKTAATQLWGGAYSSLLAGVPGKSYTISGFVKSDGTCLAYIQVRFLDSNGAYLDSAQTSGTTQTAWQFVTATNVAPAGTVSIQLGLPNANSSGAGICEFDDVSVNSISTATTDLGFSYSVRGEVTDVYESTPNSGGWYHVGGSYWASGALNTLSASFAPITITYGADGEGRISSVTASAGTNPVTSTSYNVAGQVTDVTLGSGDSDHYTYDPNTGRMTQYKFAVGATPQNVIGNLGWNANGSLASLQVADPFNVNNNQTCSYSHDDLSRIASVNCGSVWSQSFGFDPFGNISKSGSISFTAGYVPSGGGAPNNRIQTGIPNVSYDANGNLLTINDGTSHTYAWDADGKQVGIDTTTATYDAQGRLVELNKNGTYTQIVYGLNGGRLALMNGQTLTKAFVATPSGSAVFTSSGLSYYRHTDWLGSSRFASTTSRIMYSSSSFAPFGEQYSVAGTSDSSFTGQEQDTASGLYDFLYRRLSQTQGRWISPDPSGLAAVSAGNPQSWNRYAYVANGPLTSIDLFGLNMFSGFGSGWWGDWFGSDGGGGGGGGGGGFGGGFCSAEYSFEECGGESGFWGGNFGDSVAEYNRICGGLSEDVCEGLQQYLAQVNQAFSNAAQKAPNEVSNYVLQAESDCPQGDYREIEYRLRDGRNGAYVYGFWIIQFESEAGRAGGDTAWGNNSSAQWGPRFDDGMRLGTGTTPGNSIQTFTISRTPGGPQTRVNVVDTFGNVWGALGVFNSLSEFYVNGRTGPTLADCGSRKATPGKTGP